MTEIPITLTYAQTATVDTAKSSHNGFIKMLSYTLPNLTTAVSGVLTIQNTRGDTIYTSNAINENAVTLVSGLDIPLGRGFTFTFTLNAGSGAATDETIYIDVYVKDE